MVSDPYKNSPLTPNGVLNNNHNNNPASSSTFFVPSSSSSGNSSSSESRMITSPVGHRSNQNYSVSDSRVYGVVVVSDRFSPPSLNSRNFLPISSSPGGVDCTSRGNGLIESQESSLTLGSILLEREVCSCEELRRLIISQLASVPRDFIFLTKEGWPILSSHEKKVTSSCVVGAANCIFIRQVFEKPRVGVTTVEDSLGFIFANLSVSGGCLRETVDDLLKELAVSHKIPRVPDYKFIDRNGWPVLRSQEEKLSLLDLMSSHSQVRIQFRNTIEGRSLSPGIACRSLTQAIEDEPTRRAREASTSGLAIMSVMPSMIDNVDSRLVLPSTAQGQVSISEVMQEDSWKRERRGSKKSSLSRKFSSRKTEKTIKFKTDVDNKKNHCIMLSYARNEAAHHALVLKQELDKLGIPTYLDVHEITSGSDWQDSLNNAVNNCFLFVPLVTPMYGNTQWTNREVKLADLLQKKIVPINFLDAWPPECLAIQFATTQYITWLPPDVEVDRSQLDGFKIWPYVCTKKIAKMLASEVPKDWSKLSKTGQTPAKGTSSSSTQILPSLGNKSDGLLMTDGRNSFMGSNSSLVVLSGHPADISVVNRIKYSLETEGYTVWCSCDDRMSVASTPAGEGLPGSGESEDQIDRMIPSSTSCLPTINEGQSLESTGAFTDAYKELARSLVASKQRPTSLPPPPTTVCASPTIPSSIPFTIPPPVPVSQVSYSTVDGKHFQSMMEPTKRKTMLKRMLSDVCPLSSLTPDKRHRLEIFAKKVAECGVVIVVSSANYFNSATSKEQVYYCETRKKMIVVKADEFKSPPWFNNLMGIQLEVSVENPRYTDEIRGNVKRMMDPSSTNTATTEQMHEVKIQYCVRMMKNNIEYLGTCVYVLGSTRITNPRSIEICKALGAALAQVKNVTLVTTGFMGAQDMVAKSFLSSLEDIKQHRTGITDGNDNNINDASLASRIVHVLPLKDEKDLTDCCSQNEDGHFEPMSYGKTLFIGESLHERAAVLPRLLDTCILIEGDNETAREVHDFIWNDHFVIPIKSTRGAAAGEVKVPSKVFERPSGVDEMAWNLLSSSEATPAEVAAAVVKVVLGIKQHIVNLRLQQKMKESKSSKSAFKTKLRRSSKKKTGEADVPTIPEDRKQQELPVIRDGEVGDDKDGLEKEISPWKKVKGMMTFSRKST